MSGYEMTGLLQKCTLTDAHLIREHIESYINCTDDKGLKEWFAHWEAEQGVMPIALAQKLEREIRYLGSSDIAYFTRKMRGLDPAGVPVEEMLEDISKVLGFKYKKVGTLEYKLETFAKRIVEKTILEMSPEKQAEFLKANDFTDEMIDQFRSYLKNTGSKVIIPFLIETIGHTLTIQIVQTVLIALMGKFMTEKAAAEVLKVMLPRTLGLGLITPIAMAVATGWMVIDMCGPAMRKTIPILLHLSVVSLRDGVESDDFFKEEADIEEAVLA